MPTNRRQTNLERDGLFLWGPLQKTLNITHPSS